MDVCITSKYPGSVIPLALARRCRVALHLKNINIEAVRRESVIFG